MWNFKLYKVPPIAAVQLPYLEQVVIKRLLSNAYSLGCFIKRKLDNLASSRVSDSRIQFSPFKNQIKDFGDFPLFMASSSVLVTAIGVEIEASINVKINKSSCFKLII